MSGFLLSKKVGEGVAMGARGEGGDRWTAWGILMFHTYKVDVLVITYTFLHPCIAWEEYVSSGFGKRISSSAPLPRVRTSRALHVAGEGGGEGEACFFIDSATIKHGRERCNGKGDTGGKGEAHREFPNAAAYRREIRRIYNGRTCPPPLSLSLSPSSGGDE